MPAQTYDLETTTVRDIVLDRLATLDISLYEFALALEYNGICYTTTYRYLQGTSDTMVANVELMMRFLGVGLNSGCDHVALKEEIRDAAAKASAVRRDAAAARKEALKKKKKAAKRR